MVAMPSETAEARFARVTSMFAIDLRPAEEIVRAEYPAPGDYWEIALEAPCLPRWLARCLAYFLAEAADRRELLVTGNTGILAALEAGIKEGAIAVRHHEDQRPADNWAAAFNKMAAELWDQRPVEVEIGGVTPRVHPDPEDLRWIDPRKAIEWLQSKRRYEHFVPLSLRRPGGRQLEQKTRTAAQGGAPPVVGDPVAEWYEKQVGKDWSDTKFAQIYKAENPTSRGKEESIRKIIGKLRRDRTEAD
jgi:hypothetical protein